MVHVLLYMDALAGSQLHLGAGRHSEGAAIHMNGNIGLVVDFFVGQAVVNPDQAVAAAAIDDILSLVPVEGDIVGYIGMYFSLDEGEITNVAVDSRMRRRGVGEMLVKAMQKEAGQRGISSIVLEVRISNENAIRLYERNGFVNQGVRKGFYELPKEDAYIMIYGQ